jgi:hypothetical protein
MGEGLVLSKAIGFRFLCLRLSRSNFFTCPVSPKF